VQVRRHDPRAQHCGVATTFSASTRLAANGPHIAPPSGVMRVLITDGNERSALAAARSLLRARHTVHVVAASRLSLAACRAGLCRTVVGADPLADPAAYAAELMLLAQRERSICCYR